MRIVAADSRTVVGRHPTPQCRRAEKHSPHHLPCCLGGAPTTTNQTDSPFTAVLNSTQKYVASTTLTEPLPWSNSTLLKGDAGENVAGLKRQSDKDLLIMGSGALIKSLMERNLVDTFVLLIHPLELGTGRRLFAEGSPTTALRLVTSKTTATGVVIATYQPAEPAG